MRLSPDRGVQIHDIPLCERWGCRIAGDEIRARRDHGAGHCRGAGLCSGLSVRSRSLSLPPPERLAAAVPRMRFARRMIWLPHAGWRRLTKTLCGHLRKAGVTFAPGRCTGRSGFLTHADERGIAQAESRFEIGKDRETYIVYPGAGAHGTARRVDEIAINAHAWRWENRNSFWIDPQSGQVWRSGAAVLRPENAADRAGSAQAGCGVDRS